MSAVANASCAAPNFCAYTGTDVIPWGTVPNFGGAVGNNSSQYDTSFLGHRNWDGSTFSNSAYLSPITRLTDVNSTATGIANTSFAAGQGGSAAFFRTNSSTTLVLVEQQGGADFMGVFNQPGYAGLFLPYSAYSNTGGKNPGAGNLITTNMNSAGGGSSMTAESFGSGSFSLTDAKNASSFILYAFGKNADIASPTAITPYSISMAPGSVGVYTINTAIADFQYGLPAYNNTSDWQSGHSYAYGAYITHVLNLSTEMATNGAWAQNHAYAIGDVISGNGTSSGCMYVVTVAGTSGSGSAPAFKTTPQSACRTDTLSDNGITWKGTNGYPQFLYQNTGAAGTSGGSLQFIPAPATLCATTGTITCGSQTLTCGSSAFVASNVGAAISVPGAGAAGAVLYTTITAYTNSTTVTVAIPASTTVTTASVALTGHPDFLSGVPDGGNIFWTNVGPAYVPQNTNQGYFDAGRQSRDTTYGGYASKYAMGISTSSYGAAPGAINGLKYTQANAIQGTGIWYLVADATTNTYHALDGATGIWTDNACGGANLFSCGPVTTSTVGVLTQAKACPFGLHNNKLSPAGIYDLLAANPNFYPANCPGGATSGPASVWNATTASYNATTSLQYAFSLNHWDIANSSIFAFNDSVFGGTSGVFLTLEALSNPSNDSFSVFLPPFANQSIAQTYPPGCYVTTTQIKSPDCNLNEVLDNHLSIAASAYLGSDTMSACGTTYNYATLNPIPFNSWQGMETCYPTTPATTSTAASLGPVWQFTHTFATGTSLNFSAQFQVSHYSLDGNWLFFTSDWNCQNGSTLANGAAPVVWSSGTYYQQWVITPAFSAPAYGDSSSLCGLPWQPSVSGGATSNYVTGNLINPIEGTSGSGAIDDVFQALTSGQAGYASTLPGKQPKCGSVSCFATSEPPSVNSVAVTAASGTGSVATLTSTLAPSLNAFVTVVGMTNSAYNCSNCQVTATSSAQFSYASTGTGNATGSAFTSGELICDSIAGVSFDPPPPYSSSCPGGVVWQDLGPQTARSDVFAVNLGIQH